ncbi:hypothetical protein BH18ACT15_BH18ACT15_08090 [soil metagenome]
MAEGQTQDVRSPGGTRVGAESAQTVRPPAGARVAPGSGAAQSVGQLVKGITEDVSALVRAEIDLAKQELGAAVTEKVKGAVAIAIGGVMGLLALMYVTLAIRDAISLALPEWVADLITALLLGIVGLIGALFAKRKLATPIKADLTKKTIKDDVEFAKSLGKR